MLTKAGSLLKVALSAEFKQKLKTDKAFKDAYTNLNRAGGTGAQAEELFRKFYGAGAAGAGVGAGATGAGAGAGATGAGAAGAAGAGTKSGFSNFRSEAKRGFQHGFREAGFSQEETDNLFKRGKGAKYKAGLAGLGLGAFAYAGYKGYKRNRDMGLTKQGGQVKEAMLLGAIRAARLSEDDKAVLRKEYKLPNDPNFKWRNAGRNLVGGQIGGNAGRVIGQGLGSLKGKGGEAIGGLAGNLIGAGIGSWKMTSKYSKGRAEQIRRRLEAKKARLS